MSRTYERDTKHYDRAVLAHLVETGSATLYEALGIYVIKTENGTVAVRPHQIINMDRYQAVDVNTISPSVTSLGLGDGVTITAPENRVPSPMDGYSCKEEYDGEDFGPGGVAYDDALDLAQRVLAQRGDADTDPLILVRRILDENSYRRQLHEELESTTSRTGTSWVAATEQDEILKYFGIA